MRRVVLTVLLLMALAPSAFARVAYLCGMDGKVRSSCCCPSKGKAKTPEGTPNATLKAACCCEVSVVTPARELAMDEQHKTSLQPPPLVLISIAGPSLAVIRMPVRAVIARALEPPRLERPLFASHCALLL
ncbi:MAG TPA: hypothetical protein VGC41_05130 [Kofleriaceae bacterium]